MAGNTTGSTSSINCKLVNPSSAVGKNKVEVRIEASGGHASDKWRTDVIINGKTTSFNHRGNANTGGYAYSGSTIKKGTKVTFKIYFIPVIGGAIYHDIKTRTI